jgi:guanine deaminase
MQANREFMMKAIEVAKESAKNGEYPIGAVIVKDDQIISTGEVKRISENDPTAHAEVVAIREACKKLNSHSLKDCILYSTQECCPMCASAIVWAKMKGVVFGALSEDTKEKQTENFSWRQIDISCKDVFAKSNPKIELIEGFMREVCKKLI